MKFISGYRLFCFFQKMTLSGLHCQWCLKPFSLYKDEAKCKRFSEAAAHGMCRDCANKRAKIFGHGTTCRHCFQQFPSRNLLFRHLCDIPTHQTTRVGTCQCQSCISIHMRDWNLKHPRDIGDANKLLSMGYYYGVDVDWFIDILRCGKAQEKVDEREQYQIRLAAKRDRLQKQKLGNTNKLQM